MLAYETRAPDVTVAKIKNRERQTYPNRELECSRALSILQYLHLWACCVNYARVNVWFKKVDENAYSFFLFCFLVTWSFLNTTLGHNLENAYSFGFLNIAPGVVFRNLR